jgi:hypothetical protein
MGHSGNGILFAQMSRIYILEFELLEPQVGKTQWHTDKSTVCGLDAIHKYI